MLVLHEDETFASLELASDAPLPLDSVLNLLVDAVKEGSPLKCGVVGTAASSE